MTETDLLIDGVFFPVGSMRAISQSIDLVENGPLERTVNGELIDLTRSQNRKFTTTITGSDTSAPAVQGLWRGQELTIHCISPYRQSVEPANASVTLIRDPRAGFTFGRLPDGTKILPDTVVDRDVTFSQAVAMVEFLPILTCRLAAAPKDSDEYGVNEGWSIEAEEI